MALNKYAVLLRKNVIIDGGIKSETDNDTIIPFDNISIQIGSADPEKVVLVSREEIFRLAEEFKNIIGNLKYNQFYGDDRYTASLPTAKELNHLYTTTGIPDLNEADKPGTVTLSLADNPATEYDSILFHDINTGLFEEGIFVGGQWIISELKNELPNTINDIYTNLNSLNNSVDNLDDKVVLDDSSDTPLKDFNGKLISELHLNNSFRNSSAQDLIDNNLRIDISNKLDKVAPADIRFNSTDNGDRIIQNRDDIVTNADDININKTTISDNASNILKNTNDINAYSTSKQNTNLVYKTGTTVEEQIEANEKAIADTVTREGDFLKKDDGTMDAGYNATTDKQVIVKETFDTEKASVATEIAKLQSELSNKADIQDIGSQLLIYTFTTPIVPTEASNGTLTYLFGTDFATWLANQTDDGTSTGTPLITDGDSVEIIIKDTADGDATLQGMESWNNGSATTQPFGTDVNANWNTTTTQLSIDTNGQNAQTTRTLRSLMFTINAVTGNSVDSVARNEVAALKNSKQDKVIVPIAGLAATTVEDALAELKNKDDAVEDSITGISYNEPSKTTLVSDNFTVAGELKANKITQNGKEVALVGDILSVINSDSTGNTVADVRQSIKDVLNDEVGKQAVIFEHAVGTQATERYFGYVEKIANDIVEGTDAYFAESTFIKFNSADDGQTYMNQDFLNIKNWQAWQATLNVGDEGYYADNANITTQDLLDALDMQYARRTYPIKIDGINVLVDDTELAALEAKLGGI